MGPYSHELCSHLSRNFYTLFLCFRRYYGWNIKKHWKMPVENKDGEIFQYLGNKINRANFLKISTGDFHCIVGLLCFKDIIFLYRSWGKFFISNIYWKYYWIKNNALQKWYWFMIFFPFFVWLWWDFKCGYKCLRTKR